jgi:sigma-B regulation protein RsbU (phosphoserine phosphatase)
MLGVFEDASWPTLEVELFPGDLVVFYTDGVVEARRDGRFFDEDGLISAIRARQHESVSAVADHILAERSRFTGAPPEDDVAILAFRLHLNLNN